MSAARRGSLMIAVTAAFVLTMMVPAGAKPKPPVNGTGTLQCTVNAKITYSPALKANGTATSETVTLKSKLINCGGTGDGGRVSNGKSIVVTTGDTTNDCAKVLGGAGGGTTPPGTISWKGSSPKVNPSTGVTLGASTTNTSGPAITVDSSGGSVGGGSFMGDSVSTHSVITESLALITSKCQSKGGLKALHINPSGSTFTLN
jgi:hypothetical protein